MISFVSNLYFATSADFTVSGTRIVQRIAVDKNANDKLK
jgi:hypothetical protein